MSDNYLDDLFIDEVSGALKPPSGSESVKDYAQLTNLPKVNGVELKGEKSLEDLGIDLLSPETKTAEDTQAVRKDSDGKLWTKPATISRATHENYGGFKAYSTDGFYVGVPIEIDASLGFAYAALNVSQKTEADTDYTIEVKIDPVTKKLYVPASTVQTIPTEPDNEEVTE